jgi:hypothetical protein
LPYAQKPVCSLSKKLMVNFTQWKNASAKKDEYAFDRKLTAICDTLGFVDFINNEHSLVAKYEFYQSTVKDAKAPFAYWTSIYHYDGNLRKNAKLAVADTVYDYFKTYGADDNMAYESSGGYNQFGRFKLTEYKLTGAVPGKAGEFPQKLYFVVEQVGF